MEAVNADTQIDQHRIMYFGGFTFGWPKCLDDTEPWCYGCVFTPRYADRIARKAREGEHLVLDNGAWPAARDLKKLQKDDPSLTIDDVQTLEEQLQDMHEAVETVGEDRIRWIVVPDVVGDAEASWERSMKAMPELFQYGREKLLLPIQNGQDPWEVAFMAHPGGVFIGGKTTKKTKQWKFDQVRAFNALPWNVYTHIGRISSEDHIAKAKRLGVDSFDTTTFLRSYGWNAKQDFVPRLKKHCKKFTV